MRECWFELVTSNSTSPNGDPHVAVPNHNNIPYNIRQSVRNQKQKFDLDFNKIAREYRAWNRKCSQQKFLSASARARVCNCVVG